MSTSSHSNEITSDLVIPSEYLKFKSWAQKFKNRKIKYLKRCFCLSDENIIDEICDKNLIFDETIKFCLKNYSTSLNPCIVNCIYRFISIKDVFFLESADEVIEVLRNKPNFTFHSARDCIFKWICYTIQKTLNHIDLQEIINIAYNFALNAKNVIPADKNIQFDTRKLNEVPNHHIISCKSYYSKYSSYIGNNTMSFILDSGLFNNVQQNDIDKNFSQLEKSNIKLDIAYKLINEGLNKFLWNDKYSITEFESYFYNFRKNKDSQFVENNEHSMKRNDPDYKIKILPTPCCNQTPIYGYINQEKSQSLRDEYIDIRRDQRHLYLSAHQESLRLNLRDAYNKILLAESLYQKVEEIERSFCLTISRNYYYVPDYISKYPIGILDLHGLFVEDAIRIFNKSLKQFRNLIEKINKVVGEAQKVQFHVITMCLLKGYGSKSIKPKTKLFNSIVEILKNQTQLRWRPGK